MIFGSLALLVPPQRERSAAADVRCYHISLLWVAAQLISHPVFDRDDWHFMALRMPWPWIWRPLMITLASRHTSQSCARSSFRCAILQRLRGG